MRNDNKKLYEEVMEALWNSCAVTKIDLTKKYENKGKENVNDKKKL